MSTPNGPGSADEWPPADRVQPRADWQRASIGDATLSFGGSIAQAIATLARDADAWSLPTPDRPVQAKWLTVSHRDAAIPDQGWKLHVSAGVPNAEETLRRVLPVLLAEPIAFKVAASSSRLAALNDGTGVLSQVGKFVTVYPRDDAQAVRLAVRLAEVTSGLQGPPIPSDRRLRPGSVVHYRYGSFGATLMQRLTGEIAFAVRSPSGVLEPDVRQVEYRPPAWAVDPFVVGGVALTLPIRPKIVGDRFLVIDELYRSARGRVYLGVDLDSPQACVLKSAEAGALMTPEGRDARDQLRHEAAVLRRLAPDPRFPVPLALVENSDELYLVMSDLKASTLEGYVRARTAKGCTLDCGQVIAWGRELAAMLSAIHAAGLVYRDLKSTNVLVTPAGQLRIVDFEHSCEIGHSGAPFGGGTRGYMSPRQIAGEPADPNDDIYGLGAIMAYMVTGAEPSQAPRRDRPIELLNPSVDPGLATVVARILATDANMRYSSLEAVDAALAALESGTRTGSHHSKRQVRAADEASDRQRCTELSRRLGDTICHAAEPAGDGTQLAWISDHPLGLGIRGRDVNTGTAGTLLALAELVLDLGVPAHRAVLVRGVRWLAEAQRPEGDPLPGLYVGEAGVAAALLRAGQVLDDPHLIELALSRGRAAAQMPHASPDLFNGSAGRLRFHLACWDEMHAPEDLQYAVDAGEHVLATAEEAGDGTWCWRIPPGYGAMSGQAYLGYAHGAAGIADALLDLFEATNDERFLDAARNSGRWLANLGQPALDDGRGLSWPVTEGGSLSAAYWCHGSAGIGQFWLHASALDVLPVAADMAAGAVATTASGVRWAPPPQCHGLAGAIELLIDAYQASSDTARLDEARELGCLLEAFSFEVEGQIAWSSESPMIVSPDYSVGYAGVASALLRLANPESRPHGLSRSAFAYRGPGPAAVRANSPGTAGRH